MNILCRVGWHQADPDEIYNSGYYFGHCAHCNCDMIRFGGAWQRIPAGHKVVWKRGQGIHSIEPDYGRFLPILAAEARLPALIPAYAQAAGH